MTTVNKAPQYWSMTEGVFNCLIDTKRTNSFAKAIKKTVKPGDVVADMGTGTGILALLAAKAGAKKVYAIEIDPNNISKLKQTFAENGYEDTIEVIPGSVLDVTLPEKVDVIIGEMIATGLIEELQVPANNHLLKFAKKDVRVLLNKYVLHADLVQNNNVFNDFTFNVVRYEYPDEPTLKSNVVTDTAILHTFDFSKQISLKRIKASFTLTAKKSGSVNGLRVYGQTIFADGSKLGATFAYDYPIILPVAHMTLKKGDVIQVSIGYEISGGMQNLKYDVKKL